MVFGLCEYSLFCHLCCCCLSPMLSKIWNQWKSFWKFLCDSFPIYVSKCDKNFRDCNCKNTSKTGFKRNKMFMMILNSEVQTYLSIGLLLRYFQRCRSAIPLRSAKPITKIYQTAPLHCWNLQISSFTSFRTIFVMHQLLGRLTNKRTLVVLGFSLTTFLSPKSNLNSLFSTLLLYGKQTINSWLCNTFVA